MEEKIRNYINHLFAEAPRTRKAMDLKEEMAQNTIEKYQDLVSEGYSEEDAWKMVTASIGDVTELFGELEEPDLYLSEEDRKKKALLKAIAIGLYIFAGVVLMAWMMISENFFYYNVPDMGMFGLIAAGLLCIPPTCMLVYATNLYPNSDKRERSMVESYQEARRAGKRAKALKGSISAIIWFVTLILYFIISFVTRNWEITWIIFLMGGCAQAVLFLVFSLKQENNAE